MISKQQTITALPRFKNEAGSEYGIVSLGVFGSLARNEANEASDIDVVVETKEVNPSSSFTSKNSLKPF